MIDDLPIEQIGRWEYRTTRPVRFDTIAGKIIVPRGYRFYIGAKGIKIPPFAKGLLRAALLHDYLYDEWYHKPAGRAHADTAMIAEMRLHKTPWFVRNLVWIVIRAWGAFRTDPPVLAQ